MTPLISQLKMPFRTGLQNEEEGEDVVFLAKFEIKSMGLAEPGGDLNKIRRSRQTTSVVIQGGDEVVEEADEVVLKVDEVMREVDEVVREVDGAVREAEPANDQGKQGG